MTYGLPDQPCYHLRGERGVTNKIKQAMQETAKQFVYIGFLLWEVKQYEYFYEEGYSNVYEYAEEELGFGRSSTKNFIAICENFCRRDEHYNSLPTMHLDDRWSNYQYSQLTEMLSMSPKQRQETKPSMTVKQLREVKKSKVPTYATINEETGKLEIIERPEEAYRQPNGQTSGQTDGLKLVLVNNYWEDLDIWVIKEIARAGKIKWNPKSYYKITIELKKDY